MIYIIREEIPEIANGDNYYLAIGGNKEILFEVIDEYNLNTKDAVVIYKKRRDLDRYNLMCFDLYVDKQNEFDIHGIHYIHKDYDINELHYIME